MDKYRLKTRTRISNAVDTELWNQLKELSNSTQIPISKLLDNAIKMLINSYETTKK